MVGINISMGNLREADAHVFYKRFDILPTSFSIPGRSPTWINTLLGLSFLVAFFAQGNTRNFFLSMGVSPDWAGTLAVGSIFLCLAIQPIAAGLIRWVRTRVVHMSDTQVTIEYPNNPFEGAVIVPLREYRGLSRRWGKRYRRRRPIKQEIIELLHQDTSRTIPVRVTEDYKTNSEDLISLAGQFGVDYLADGFKKPTASVEPKSVAQVAQPVVRQTSHLPSPPKGVRLDTRVGSSKFGNRISLDFPWDPFLSRLVVATLTATGVVVGWFLHSNFLVVMGGMLFIPVAWRTLVGSPGISSLLIEADSLVLEPDKHSLLARFGGAKRNLRTINLADVHDIYLRQRQDGKRHELILQTDAREISVDLTLGRDGLQWVSDYLRQKIGPPAH